MPSTAEQGLGLDDEDGKKLEPDLQPLTKPLKEVLGDEEEKNATEQGLGLHESRPRL